MKFLFWMVEKIQCSEESNFGSEFILWYFVKYVKTFDTLTPLLTLHACVNKVLNVKQVIGKYFNKVAHVIHGLQNCIIPMTAAGGLAPVLTQGHQQPLTKLLNVPRLSVSEINLLLTHQNNFSMIYVQWLYQHYNSMCVSHSYCTLN